VLQSVSLTQPHVAEAGMQTGVAGSVAQALLSSDEQSRHSPALAVPAGWQAGIVDEGHENGPGFVAA